MFGRKANTAPIAPTPEAAAPTQAVSEAVGEAAVVSALWTPGSNGTRAELNGAGVLVTDKRRDVGINFHLGVADEIYAKNQERLKTPLTQTELAGAVNILGGLTVERRETLQKEAGLRGAAEENVTAARDAEGDARAVNVLKRMLGGETLGYLFASDASLKQEGKGIGERLDDMVGRYADLTAQNHPDDQYLGSMGGTVEIGDGGEVHFGGYNNGTLYEVARAKQIWDQLQADPRQVRTDVLEAEQPNAEWLVSGPVIVEQQPLQDKAAV